MAIGLSRQEQWALIGTVALILAGLGFDHWRHRPGPAVAIDDAGRWEKLADFSAGGRPATPAAANAAGPAGVTAIGSATARAAADSALAETPFATTRTLPTANAPDRAARAAPESAATPVGGIDINRATAEELDRLPGIGLAKAAAILETRRRLGGFATIEQLAEVPGIGPATLARLRPYLYAAPAARATPMARGTPVAAAVPIAPGLPNRNPLYPTARRPEATPRSAAAPLAARTNINTATATELEALPGVGPVLAGRIVEDRRRNGPYRRPEDLLRVGGIGPAKLRAILPAATVGNNK
ncbi:MAG: helix-hairpin-helix domain-containing protein [bacterium]|nr:helix-hairpin-helix domain-containing protein [bacterium]